MELYATEQYSPLKEWVIRALALDRSRRSLQLLHSTLLHKAQHRPSCTRARLCLRFLPISNAQLMCIFKRWFIGNYHRFKSWFIGKVARGAINVDYGRMHYRFILITIWNHYGRGRCWFSWLYCLHNHHLRERGKERERRVDDPFTWVRTSLH